MAPNSAAMNCQPQPFASTGGTWCYLTPMTNASSLPEIMTGQQPSSEMKSLLHKDFPHLTSMLPPAAQPSSGQLPSEQLLIDPPVPSQNVTLTGLSPASLVVPDQTALASDKRFAKAAKSKKSFKSGSFLALTGKKRTRNPEEWKKNVSKKNKLHGLAHLSRNGTIIPAKRVEEVDCSACLFQCSQNYSEGIRSEIFDMFYSLGTNEIQKQFVCQNVTEEATKHKSKISSSVDETDCIEKPNRRTVTRRYYLPKRDNSRHQVCSQFFRATLAIGKSFISHALKHKKFGMYMGQEKRGKPHNKTPVDQMDIAQKHIASALGLDPSDLEQGKKKKSVKKQCLEKGLTVTRMYQLFRIDCENRGVVPVSLSIYRRIFQEQF